MGDARVIDDGVDPQSIFAAFLLTFLSASARISGAWQQAFNDRRCDFWGLASKAEAVMPVVSAETFVH